MTLTNIFLGEWLGTMVLIIIGNGAVANVIFKMTKGAKGGLIAITMGGAIAVLAGVAVANIFNTGGHLNPAVTLGFGVGGEIDAGQAFTFIGAQLLGALMGQVILNTIYGQHIKAETPETVLGMHATTPTHPKAWPTNVATELVATLILVVMAYFAIKGNWFNGAPLAISLTVLGIGIALGGTTGYAINPARDLMPRIVHSLMYVSLKRQLQPVTISAQMSAGAYGGVPVVAPLAAGAIAGGFFYV